MKFTAETKKGKKFHGDMGLPSLDNVLAILAEVRFAFGHGDSIIIGDSRFERCGQSWREYDLVPMTQPQDDNESPATLPPLRPAQKPPAKPPAKPIAKQAVSESERTDPSLLQRSVVIQQFAEESTVQSELGNTPEPVTTEPPAGSSNRDGTTMVGVGNGTNKVPVAVGNEPTANRPTGSSEQANQAPMGVDSQNFSIGRRLGNIKKYLQV